MEFGDLKKIINKINLKNSDTVYIAGNIFNFGLDTSEVSKFNEHLYKYVKKKIEPSGNIVVPVCIPPD